VGLNLVLLGRRSGTPTWNALRRVLTAEEFDLIHAFAMERRERDGETDGGLVGEMRRLRLENQMLRLELEKMSGKPRATPRETLI